MGKALPKKPLVEIPYYKDYCLRYRYQFLKFVVEASGKFPTWQQRELMNAMSVPNFMVSCVSGHGCHAKGHGIRMYDGSVKRVEDVVVGDQLMGDDGTPRNVLLLNRGSEDMRRVIPDKGEPFVVNNSHLLSLKYRCKPGKNQAERYLENPLDVSVEEFLSIPDWDKNNFSLWNGDNEAFSGIKAIEYLPEDEYFGFEIDGNHLYQDEDGTIHHNTGKSFTYAWFIIWHVTVFPFSNLILTGPKFEQLRKIIWKELSDALEILYKTYPWLSGYFIKDAKSFYALGFKDNWFAIPQTAPRKHAYPVNTGVFVHKSL
ncbi:hypothetical protein KKI24_17020 [bacterium]|nr:hypothetical protein [bacterium]